MKYTSLTWIASAVFALATGMPAAQAQQFDRPPAVFNQDQLDQMLAPIALYPDALLAQILMASTYPLEVVQAARFVDSRPGLQGTALSNAVAPMPWDPSVKSLVQFPSVLAMMNDQLDWTQNLGDAFLSQQANVMDTVQNLRMKAQIAGNLQSGSQQRIIQQDQLILIEPVNPQIIYVPYYNPVVVYGGWWWPQRPPLYWTPPPRYRPPSYNVSINIGIAFGAGIARSFYADARPDWRQHHVVINNVRINNPRMGASAPNDKPVIWQHNPRDNTAWRRPPGNNAARPQALPGSVHPSPSIPARPATPPSQARPAPPTAPAVEPRNDARERNAAREVRERNRPAAAPQAPAAAPAPVSHAERPQAQARPQAQPVRPPQAVKPAQQAAPRQDKPAPLRPDARPRGDERSRNGDER